MKAQKAQTGTYIPRAVSPNYRLDWNYAVQVVRIPTLTLAAQIIVSAPILTQFSSLLNFHHLQVILIWASALSFLIGYVVLLIRMPLFLRENPNFKTYQDRGNAHRWILWNFDQNFNAFLDPPHALREMIDKGLAYRVGDLSPGPDVFGVTPITEDFPAPKNKSLQLLKPVNFNNDLYLPIFLDGDRYILPIQQSDPNVDKREKEIFWIIYTALASTRLKSRWAVWILFVVSAGCFIAAIGIILFHIWSAVPVRSINYV